MLITALATPLDSEGRLDIKSFHKLLQHQKKGADGVIVAGTTGQGTLLTDQEKSILLQATRDYPFSRGLCVSDLSLDRVLKNMDLAERQDVQYLLVTPPFFVRPTQQAILTFYTTVLEKAPCPVILYNNPSRVGVAIETSVYKSLKGHKNLLGVKESQGKSLLKGINIPVFCGDDEWIVSYKKQGSIGAISVLSNVFVETVKKAMCLDPFSEDLLSLLKRVFVSVNPLSIQYILHKNHLFSTDRVKAEIGALQEDEKLKIDAVLEEAWGKLALAF
ncbi:MAG: dihydrodipicolinate synthase family protein [Chlamydiae bacterium]|nr:dihydrodipicolinate synthase family protein [Chlamydiota bacterium]